MRFDKIFQAVGPAMMAAAMGARSQGGAQSRDRGPGIGGTNFNFRADDFRFNGLQGKPLGQLDLGGEVPTDIVLVGPDNVVISQGEDFAIAVQGNDEAKAAVRFSLKGETLFIMQGAVSAGQGTLASDRATINLTMAPPRKVIVAGSGTVATSALAKKAQVVIAGSGQLSVLDLAIKSLSVTIAGSGRFTAGGKAKRLQLNVAGSGTADMDGLKCKKANITIAGSGTSVFTCNGEVEANIMGSGNVTVRGKARCKVRSMGSGALVCEPANSQDR